MNKYGISEAKSRVGFRTYPVSTTDASPRRSIKEWFVRSAVFVTAISLVLSAFVPTQTYAATTVTWTGNGTDDGVCSSIEEDENLEEGTQVWQFNLTKLGAGPHALTAEFSDGTEVTGQAPDDVNGGVAKWYIETDEGATLESASAVDGTLKKDGSVQSNLVISHCSVAPSDEEEPGDTVTVTIVKYLDGQVATAQNANSSAFPMHAIWDDPEGIGTSQGDYSLDTTGHNNANAYYATTSDMSVGADYSTYEVMGDMVAANCAGDEPYALDGYGTGATLQEAVADQVSDEHPQFTDLQTDMYVVVRNVTCDDDEPEPEPCVDGIGWAAEVESSDQGLRKDGGAVLAARSDTNEALGAADWVSGTASNFYTLGFGGVITLSFAGHVTNQAGDDLSVYEATNGSYPNEKVKIEVSQNGSNWETLSEEASNTSPSGVTAVDIDETSFDWIQYVRLTDTSNPALFPNDADGFDLDAVRATYIDCDDQPVPTDDTISGTKWNDVNGDGQQSGEGETGLAGFEIVAVDADIEHTYTVDSTDMDGTTHDVVAGEYLVIASGMWMGSSDADGAVDAEYTTSDMWANHMDGSSGYAGAGVNQGDLIINNAFANWGPYMDSHTYAMVYTHTGGPLNFSVFDGDATTGTKNASWYGDNSGSLTVNLYKVLDSDITDADGNYELNVDSSGNVRIYEIQKAGWTQTYPTGPNYHTANIDGDATVTDKDFGNREGRVLGDNDTMVHFIKAVCENYSGIKANFNPSYLDATGGNYIHFSELPPFVNGQTDPSEIPDHCDPADGWQFKLSTDMAQTENVWTTPVTSGGEYSILLSDMNEPLRDAAVEGQLWVSEVMQDGYDFALLRCHNNGAYGDNLEEISLDGQTPEDVYCIAYNVPEDDTDQLADVTICKENAQGTPLSGWEVFLKGALADSVSVPSNGSTVSSDNLTAGDYVLEASGTYVYRPGSDGDLSDAAFSERIASDVSIDPSFYDGAFLPWVRVNDFAAPYQGFLGVQVDGGLFDWGGTFNASHEYSGSYNLAADGNIDFMIEDDFYGDNSGSLTVDIYPIYSGITGDNGCVTIEDVPYGSYSLDEIMQDGWINVDGRGDAAVVDSDTETFTLVNTTSAVDNFSDVTICKEDESGNELSGWDVFLRGSLVETVEVDSSEITGADTSAVLESGKHYLAVVSGTWTNRPGETVDAAYVTDDGWVSHSDAPDGGYSDNLLELRVDNSFVDWGDFDSSHMYSTIVHGDGSTVNFGIFDGDVDSNTQNPSWFGDNEGTLTVDIYNVYGGVTGGNGCVTIDNVPFGAYTLDEIMQSGWSNVSGRESDANVDQGTETFTLVNTEGDVEPEPCEEPVTTTLVSGLGTQTAGYTTTNPEPTDDELDASFYSSGSFGSAVLANTVIGPWIDPAVHADYTGSGALWISTTAAHPGEGGGQGAGDDDQWRLFRHQFTIPDDSTTLSGTLNFTADNAVSVYLNGTLIGDTSDQVPTYSDTPTPLPGVFTGSYTIPFTPVEGQNTLSFVVRNSGIDISVNPTGLLYNASYTYTPECDDNGGSNGGGGGSTSSGSRSSGGRVLGDEDFGPGLAYQAPVLTDDSGRVLGDVSPEVLDAGGSPNELPRTGFPLAVLLTVISALTLIFTPKGLSLKK